jgi:hypothetical protein
MMTTVAPGMTAPWVSWTTPLMDTELCWVIAAVPAKMKTAIRSNVIPKSRTISQALKQSAFGLPFLAERKTESAKTYSVPPGHLRERKFASIIAGISAFDIHFLTVDSKPKVWHFKQETNLFAS